MSGGGSKKKVTGGAAKKASGGPEMQEVTFNLMPGQTGLLADQLAAGGYGTPQGILAELDAYYEPFTVNAIAPRTPAGAGGGAPAPAPAPARRQAPARNQGGVMVPRTTGNGQQIMVPAWLR